MLPTYLEVIFLSYPLIWLVTFLKIKLLFCCVKILSFVQTPSYTGICLYFLIELLGFHFFKNTFRALSIWQLYLDVVWGIDQKIWSFSQYHVFKSNLSQWFEAPSHQWFLFKFNLSLVSVKFYIYTEYPPWVAHCCT